MKLEQLSRDELDMEEQEKPSVKDMLKTFNRLIRNPTLMCNCAASVFYFFGYIPFWIFTPKYLEVQYRVSASTSSLVTGTVALAFSAIGVLLSGVVLSKYKPRARYMAAWNVFVGAMSVVGMVGYIFLGCPDADNTLATMNLGHAAQQEFRPNVTLPAMLGNSCSSNCHCDYVKYSPVCGVENDATYISACHAGCRDQVEANGAKLFTNCSCVRNQSALIGEEQRGFGVDSLVGMCVYLATRRK